MNEETKAPHWERVGAIAQALATLEAAGWRVPLDARTATPPLRDDRMLYVPCITKDDLAAILRADPDRAVEAIEMARIAGPRSQPNSWGGVHRLRWGGMALGTNLENADEKDTALLADGWVLAKGGER